MMAPVSNLRSNCILYLAIITLGACYFLSSGINAAENQTLEASSSKNPSNKPKIKALYHGGSEQFSVNKPTNPQVKPNPQSTSVVLDNDYPLPPADLSTPAKKQLKATYSEHGILSDLGVSKRKVYQYEKNGITAFTDSQPSHNNFRILLYECFACRPDSTIDWYKTPLFTTKYSYEISQAARRYHVEPALIRAVIHAESAFRSNVVSKAGAMGLMQLMPGTAKDMQVNDAFKAGQNILGGSRYLAMLLTRFNGNMELACAAYNSGPSTVEQYNGVPPYPETKAYVQRVKILYSRYRKVS
nr:lytic transglycosylase domain-containing protein [Shewanella gaetbuli]